jgi:beta-glucosidase
MTSPKNSSTLRNRAVVCLACGLIILAAGASRSQTVPAEVDDTARVDQLLAQMTIEEKVNLIRGAWEPAAENQGQAGYLPGVPRLGVPSLRMADGPPGLLTRVPAQAQTATMGVAATWSRHTAQENGIVIGKDARALGIDVVLQPFINIDRDLNFARGYNTFGEDPYLTGEIGAAEIKGIQAQGVMAQAKHYVAYDSDGYNIVLDPQTLHEVYVAPFAAAVAAGVSSIMCSYNRLNGPFACGNSDVLLSILKGELGFKGFVTSDWGAVHNVRFINSGLDMEMPGDVGTESPLSMMGPAYFRTQEPPSTDKPKLDPSALAGLLGGKLPEEPQTGFAFPPADKDSLSLGQALKDGSVTEATVTAAARRVLHEMDRFGYLDGKQKHDVTAEPVEESAQIIERTAEEAAVLLKNEGGILPLKSADLGSLAMIGPTAGQVAAIGTFGERSPGLVSRQVGPVDALKELSPRASVIFAVNDDMTGEPIPAAALSHDGQPGLLRQAAGTLVDAIIDFTAQSQSALPANSSASWRGELSVPVDGSYWLYLQVLGGRAVMKLDGKELGRTGAVFGTVHGDIQYATQDNVIPTTDGLDNVRRAVQLTAGKHALAVELSPDSSNAPAQIRLAWMTPDARVQAHKQAIDAAKHAHTAVVFVWTRGKPLFALPGDQDALIEEVAAANSNTIVVLNTSQPVAMPWLAHVKGVLEMWWPGDEGGWATSKILLGKATPSGHLPVTWAKRLADYPATDPSHPERADKGVDHTTTYSEGLLVGYRWFDSQHIEPQFPFGFGLGYGAFAISDVRAERGADGGASVHLRLRNTGKTADDAVPQIYLEAPLNRPDGVAFAPRTLAGFERVHLAPGASRDVDIPLAPRALQFWSEHDQGWKIPTGPRTIRVGFSERDLAASATLQ